MGGNALNFKTRRVDSDEFFALSVEVCGLLGELYPNTKLRCLDGGVKNKNDFGDLDIIICKDPNTNYSFADIKRAFNSKDYNLNSNTWSFDYKDFQIDLVFIEPQYFESSCLYYKRGDCGNLLGRLFHKFGLKFGHKGLSYIINHGNYPFAEIILSQKIDKICSFVGVDYAEYEKGFETVEDLFKFVASSRYFNPDIFLLDNQNHQNRTRDRKRAMYCAFLKWCQTQENLNHFQFPEDKSEWFLKIESYFPGFLDKLNYYKEQIDRVEQFKVKYNGELVSQFTGLQGKDLGQFMAYLKNEVGGKEELMKKVLDMHENDVKLLIEEHYKQYDKRT